MKTKIDKKKKQEEEKKEKNKVLSNYTVIARDEILNSLYDAYGPNFEPAAIVSGVKFKLDAKNNPRAVYSPTIFNINTTALEDEDRKTFNQNMIDNKSYVMDRIETDYGEDASTWLLQKDIDKFTENKLVEPKRKNFKLINPQDIFNEAIKKADKQFDTVNKKKKIKKERGE